MTSPLSHLWQVGLGRKRLSPDTSPDARGVGLGVIRTKRDPHIECVLRKNPIFSDSNSIPEIKCLFRYTLDVYKGLIGGSSHRRWGGVVDDDSGPCATGWPLSRRGRRGRYP